ncbi:pilus assembly protein [Pseudomonas matsuisoli]|uniref:Pilus assembly protein n=2 Tax=Pseudomonas matsuisoli TaxID=1515666 RepID=A0A917Q211_9PSED|nr:pilus assembly protein [Pseudomonas matsuisoli]
MPAVGKLLSHAAAGYGAVATQAQINPYLGLDGLRLLCEGHTAEEALALLQGTDPCMTLRQVALIDANARTACWTGDDCLPWAGSRQGEGYSVQGNRLAGKHVIDAVANAFLDRAEQPLIERLLEAVAAGDATGGDRHGESSATLYVVDQEAYPLWDIRVDQHLDPVTELRRLHDVFAREVVPEILRMPTRANPAGKHGEDQV